VLLIDTSGSMAPGDRLPLLQQGFRLFAAAAARRRPRRHRHLRRQAQTALEPTPDRRSRDPRRDRRPARQRLHRRRRGPAARLCARRSAISIATRSTA
jgi:hypothetical protein